jgi:hypothetical protein
MLIALAIFAGLVVYMTTMLCLTYMLSLIIQNSVIDLQLSSPAAKPSPPDAGALIADRGATGQAAGEVARHPRALRAVGPGGTTGYGESGEGDGGDIQSLALGTVGDSLQPSDGLNDVLTILHRSVGEVFPANLVTMKCSGCGQYISRFQGYRHIKVGEKRTFCEACHQAMGLPVRSL